MTTRMKGEVGSSATVEGVTYESDSRGFITVENGEHVAVLSQHPHSWVPEEKDNPNEALYGSSILPAQIDVGLDSPVALGDVVAIAHRDSGLTAAEWNDEPEDARERRLQAVVDVMRASNVGHVSADAQLDLDFVAEVLGEAAPAEEPEPEPEPAGEETRTQISHEEASEILQAAGFSAPGEDAIEPEKTETEQTTAPDKIDFTKNYNRSQIVEWLTSNGGTELTASDRKDDLVAAAVARQDVILAGAEQSKE